MRLFLDDRLLACLWAMHLFNVLFKSLLMVAGQIPFTVLPPIRLELSFGIQAPVCSVLTLIDIPVAISFLTFHWRRLEWKR